jgi:hypothetical protein
MYEQPAVNKICTHLGPGPGSRLRVLGGGQQSWNQERGSKFQPEQQQQREQIAKRESK